MDIVRGIEDRASAEGDGDHAVVDRPAIGTDERRMHVRAYNHWVSLLRGRAFPSIDSLEPENIADFGANSVLLDFTGGIEDPTIRFLGQALREECGVDASIHRVADVPSRSLLSRLTDHYLQIIANRAPIGFEAEFVSQRGNNTLYRGILMPFSSDGESIDFIYGVINWKELVDAETQAKLDAELAEARRTSQRPATSTPVWADGPGAAPAPDQPSAEPIGAELPYPGALADHLALAQETAAAVRASDTRSRAALYRALGRAYDFTLAAEGDQQGYRTLLAQARINVQARAPMTAIAKLVFGTDYDKTRLTEFATVLSHARRIGIAAGALRQHLETFDGGIKAIVREERTARRPAPRRDLYARAAEELWSRPPLGQVPGSSESDSFVVLLARPGAVGTLDVIARVNADRAMTERLVRRALA